MADAEGMRKCAQVGSVVTFIIVALGEEESTVGGKVVTVSLP